MITVFLIVFNLSISCFCSDIVVVTMTIGERYKGVVAAGIENKMSYCKMHGYDFINCGESLDNSRPVPWTKVLLILDVMKNKQYKWIFWTDADSLIMNKNKKLEEFIDDGYELIITKDLNAINSGQFFIKNSEWSNEFLHKVYSHEEFINHHWWEQMGVITELQDANNLMHVKIMPQRTFNSYQGFNNLEVDYHPGDFIIHFPGTGAEKLSKLMYYYGRFSKRHNM
jgi:hypothetical protein